MTKLSLSSISLETLHEEDIEEVRQWRNNQKISKHMFFRNSISKKQQYEWFKSLNPEKDFFFIILHKNRKIGLAHLSKIDLKKSEGEVGLFIFEDTLWGTREPVLASLLLLYFSFKIKNLNRVKAKVLSENKKAQQYNESLGFSPIKGNIQTLDKDNFINRREKLFELLKVNISDIEKLSN